jgi:DNA mismatch repair protein MutL
MGKIKVLPQNVANQIAAGEVVVRPASCVKELIENSIDAGATAIEVAIEDAGKKLIEVKDDGSGMDEDDAKASFLRHATSKIREIGDLNAIDTMGFRGEALASISSVALVEMLTATGGGAPGTWLSAEASEIIKEEKRGANKGTVIRVKQLFYNTPARLKFLKSNYTEEAQIIDTVTAAALSNEKVSFRLTIDAKEKLYIPPKTALKEAIKIIFGKEVYAALLPVEAYSDNVKATGFACRPSVTKNTRTGLYFFVNNRPIASKRLPYAVIDGYGTLLMKGAYPVAYIFIDINPSLIDVNVHPAKAEIKFRDEQRVYLVVKEAVENAMKKANLTITPSDIPQGGVKYDAGTQGVQAAVEEFFTSETPALFSGTSVHNDRQAPQEVRSNKREYLWIKAIGQVKKTYIVGEDDGNLIVIDQHAAHEKVLYEELMTKIKEGRVRIQEMLIPEVVEVTAGEKLIVENNLPVFEKLGFTLELFGEKEFKVSAHPVLVREKAVAPLVKDMIGLLQEKGKAGREEVMKDLAATIACRAAIKAGDEINNEEIGELLNRYFAAEEPFSCPHGRPPMLKISFDEIEKMFKRKL